jgi:hypothetical protein
LDEPQIHRILPKVSKEFYRILEKDHPVFAYEIGGIISKSRPVILSPTKDRYSVYLFPFSRQQYNDTSVEIVNGEFMNPNGIRFCLRKPPFHFRGEESEILNKEDEIKIRILKSLREYKNELVTLDARNINNMVGLKEKGTDIADNLYIKRELKVHVPIDYANKKLIDEGNISLFNKAYKKEPLDYISKEVLEEISRIINKK